MEWMKDHWKEIGALGSYLLSILGIVIAIRANRKAERANQLAAESNEIAKEANRLAERSAKTSEKSLYIQTGEVKSFFDVSFESIEWDNYISDLKTLDQVLTYGTIKCRILIHNKSNNDAVFLSGTLKEGKGAALFNNYEIKGNTKTDVVFGFAARKLLDQRPSLHTIYAAECEIRQYKMCLYLRWINSGCAYSCKAILQIGLEKSLGNNNSDCKITVIENECEVTDCEGPFQV